MTDSAGIGDQCHSASFFFQFFASSDRYRICGMDGWISPSVFSFSIIILLPDMYIQLPAVPVHGFLVFSGKCHKSSSLYDRVVMPKKILEHTGRDQRVSVFFRRLSSSRSPGPGTRDPDDSLSGLCKGVRSAVFFFYVEADLFPVVFKFCGQSSRAGFSL